MPKDRKKERKKKERKKPTKTKLKPHLKWQYFEKLPMFKIILFFMNLLTFMEARTFLCDGRERAKRFPRQAEGQGIWKREPRMKIPVIFAAVIREHCPFLLIS